MMFLKKRNPIGLDIGSSYIKSAQLNDTQDGYELSFVSIHRLDEGLIVDGIIADKKRLAASLREALKLTGVKRGDAVLGVSGHSSVIIKKIVVPVMTGEELGASIKSEAEQYIPYDFDVNDVNIDFEILGATPDEAGQMDVILVAARKKVIADYAEVVDMAGLDPVIMDADAFALSNMYELNYSGSGKKNVALVNVGASKTNISVVHEGLLVFGRDSAVGSSYHTEVLEKDLGISHQDAERLKLGQSVAGISSEKAEAALAVASDEICTDIYRSFEYFKSSAVEEEVGEVILSGGAALIKKFPEMMAEKLGLQVELADPFKKIKIPEKLGPSNIRQIAPMVAVAVGLALRHAGDRL